MQSFKFLSLFNRDGMTSNLIFFFTGVSELSISFLSGNRNFSCYSSLNLSGYLPSTEYSNFSSQTSYIFTT